jgi:hypothetical protein
VNWQDEELVQAELRVAEGSRRVQEQRKLIATLQQDGQNTRQATELLRVFEDALKLF